MFEWSNGRNPVAQQDGDSGLAAIGGQDQHGSHGFELIWLIMELRLAGLRVDLG